MTALNSGMTVVIIKELPGTLNPRLGIEMALESDPLPLSILHLEDDPLDAEYFSQVLREGGLDCRIIVADSKEAFAQALAQPKIDVILSDNSVPTLNGSSALALAKSVRPNIPFIFLSGSIGEEAAVESLKNGATDYILKHRHTRLVAAVKRALSEQSEREERKKAEMQLAYDAFHDSLTGLFNRSFFTNQLRSTGGREKGRFATLMLGLDHFGGINDGLGRKIGDQVLIAASERIEGKMRPMDTLARISGGEFAILMQSLDNVDGAIQWVKLLQREFESAFHVASQDLFVTLSAGIVLGGNERQSPDEILRNSGIALNQAKSLGKSSVAVFDAAMHAQAIALLSLETDLRYAIERDEFLLHYQPIIALGTGKLAGFEALVRWNHPTRGLVPPLDFIPVAEKSHLINDIGKIVLEKACTRMQAWHSLYPQGRHLTISVNVSGKEFRQSDLIRGIQRILSATRLDMHFLKLEITETAIMDDPEAAAKMLLELCESGISLQIDDFGTGYSSLGYLHKFPMQALKIDRSFVNMIGNEGENSELAITITDLAHNLGMQVIAEGIETPEQLRFLKMAGCDFGQGFYFAKPMEEDAAERLIAQE